MRRRICVLALALLAAAACADTPTAPAAHEVGDLSPSLAFTNPAGKTVLGGLDLLGYCGSEGYPSVGYRLGYIAGPHAAYGNWVCHTGPDQFNPTEPRPVNMTKACQRQYSRRRVQAHPDDRDHAWSWKCYASS